jgi:predicted DNA-binding protein (UPF0251 family)
MLKNTLTYFYYEYIIITGEEKVPRPCKCRFVNSEPQFLCFKPWGIPHDGLEEIELGLDELEAIRLADLEGLYQTDAAKQMGVSQATCGRLLASARRKIADAIIHGRALMINGGKVMRKGRTFTCDECHKDFTEPFGSGRPEKCPNCGSGNFHRTESERGMGMGRGRGGCGHGGMGGYRVLDTSEEVEKKEGETN